MRCHFDLHIHSCLSPCSDDDMTPNNIVNMSVLKGLDIIAVSDHNSVGNTMSVLAAAERAQLLALPAMELCTAEEIHLLCLFPCMSAALEFEREVYRGAEVPRNRPDVFGHQWRLDADDEVVGTEHRMLLAASVLDMDGALREVRRVGGVAIPAHVDRDAYSILATLGVIPADYGFSTVEISARADADAVRKAHPETVGLRMIVNSDAHHLWDISEPVHVAELPECTAAALLAWLREPA